jgi:thioredoxin reductase
LKPGTGGRLEAIRLVDGSILPCRALFFITDCVQTSALPEKLGCEIDERGSVRCAGSAATGVPGLFVAGNVRGGMHLAITAAAEGAEAAVAINDFLLGQDVAGYAGR